jgi:hypothetical protein
MGFTDVLQRKLSARLFQQVFEAGAFLFGSALQAVQTEKEVTCSSAKLSATAQDTQGPGFLIKGFTE